MGVMEIERRPHWDDDLVAAVVDRMYHCVDCLEDDYPDIDPRDHASIVKAWAYAVIAAVEEWHKAKRASRDRTHSDECWRWHQECAEHLIEAQQATIRRVQAVCGKNPGPSWDSYVEGYNDALSVVQAAMEGDADAYTVKRVRYVAFTGGIAAPVLTEHDRGYNLALSDVRRALGGDSDE